MPILILSSSGYYITPSNSVCEVIAWLHEDNRGIVGQLKTVCDLMLAGF